MSDVFAHICSAICAICCICCSQSLGNWCLLRSGPAPDGTGRQAGCCNSCCKKGFDDDEFEQEEVRLQQEAAARRARSQSQSQPMNEINPPILTRKTSDSDKEDPSRVRSGSLPNPWDTSRDVNGGGDVQPKPKPDMVVRKPSVEQGEFGNGITVPPKAASREG